MHDLSLYRSASADLEPADLNDIPYLTNQAPKDLIVDQHTPKAASARPGYPPWY